VPAEEKEEEKAKPDRRSGLLPPLALNRRLRDPGCWFFAGLQNPARPAQQGCSAAVASVRPICGSGDVFEKKMKTGKGWQGAGPELS
jgi:hypothetical protein